MSTGRPASPAFQREVRHFVFGGLAFVLFLAAASLIGLQASTDWALLQNEKRIAAETLALADRLGESSAPGPALTGDPKVVERLRTFRVLEAAVYDRRGALLAQAAFLPWASAVPPTLGPDELAAGAEPTVVRIDLQGTPALVSVVRVGNEGAVLRLLFDGSAVARARWAGYALTAGVAVTALLLAGLTIPFLRRLLRPIEELTETARHVGTLVPPPPGGEPRSDEPRRAVATFARTIEELRKRSEEVEVLRLRELAALGEMSAGIAHEFRNATATILGYVRLASGNVGEEARKRHLAAIQKEAEHVARVTGDFLFFARPGELTVEKTDLDSLVGEVVAEEAIGAEGTSFAVEGTFGEAVVNPLLLRRALVNLLRNAREAASEGGRAGKVLVRGESTPGQAVLAVEDDGPGVPPDEIPKAFVPFHSTKESGTGLGLALVARIANLHGGSASIERSSRIGGARVVVTLAAGLTTEAASPAPPSSSPPAP